MKNGNSSKCLSVFWMVLVLTMIGKSESLAQKDYPNRSIEVVVTFTAGGMTDLVVRIMNDELSKILGVPVVTVNKGGAGGAIGAQYVAQAKADGYTIMGTSASTLVLVPATVKDLPYKPSDFVPIARIAGTPFLFTVRKGAPWKTFEELIAFAKRNPGKLSCSTVGVGTGAHFFLELLKLEAGVDIKAVPFKGGGEVNSALLGGHVDLGANLLTNTLPYLKSGDMRPLVTMERLKEFPEVPTLGEKGYPGVAVASWVGYAGPKGMEKAVVEKIANAIERALKNSTVVKKLEETGNQVNYVAKEEFAREVDRDINKYADVVKRANLVLK